jgi:predicted NACHT family NTPase
MLVEWGLVAWGCWLVWASQNLFRFFYRCGMSRNIGWGEPEQKNSLNLVEALLSHADEELELDDALKTAVKVEWFSASQLRVTGKEQQKRGNRIVEVGTRKEHLVALIKKTGKRLQLGKGQGSQQEKELDAIQTVIDCLRQLGVLKEDRNTKKNQGYWKFTLELQQQTASRDKNLAVVKQKWQEKIASNVPESSPITEKNIDWRDICDKVVATQQLRRQATAQQYELNIYVPLGLMERPKTPNPIPNPTGEESRQKEPELQIVQTYKDDAFFQKVIAENRTEKGKHIAIIGEPGAGKTTLLGELAERLPKNSPDFPICIRLADLRESTIEDYLLHNWLKKTLYFIDADAENVTPEIRKALKQLFRQGKVWLLLDAVDEMAAESPVQALAKIREQLTDWVGKARVVLTCRLNVWDAAISNTLTNFDTYKTLEFEPDDVDKFIHQWFEQASQDEKRRNSGNESFWQKQGKQLQQQLKASGKERIRELVRNPLRLSMLCQSWCVAERDLPSTKAALYEQFTTYFFEWKQEEFQKKHRVLKETDKKQIQQALEKLALAAMESANRFRIEQEFAIEQMEEQWFDLADELGWLVLVDRDTRTKKPVYAFFHPTFQEYFAACAIPDWHYFLDHQLPPVSDCYRIFERQWKEVILLWLGRGEIEAKKKQEFIEALVNFEDRCGDFYKYRAYFIAAAGIAEFKECSYKDEIVERVIEWKVGDLNAKNNNFYLPNQIQNAATAALLETHCENLVNTLNKWLNYSQIHKKFPEIAMLLVQVAPGHSEAIRILVNYLDYLQQEFEHSKIINFDHLAVREHLRKFSAGHPLATAALGEPSQNKQQTKPIPSESDISPLNLSTGNDKWENLIRLKKEIDIKKVEKIIGRLDDISKLIILLERKPILNTYSQDGEDINTLIEVLNKLDTSRNSVFYDLTGSINLFAVDRLAEIASIQSSVVSTLEEILNSNNNIDICQKITWVLGKAASKNIDATKAVVKLLTTTHEPILAREAIYFLKTIPNSNLLAIVVLGLKDYIKDSETPEIMWHCAQIMPYPDFYQAWHQDTLPDSATASINLANLPHILAEAINNQPDLCSKVKLICIDYHQFIDPENPAPEIYDEMLNQNCPEWQNGYPDTMQKIKIYWNSLRRQSEIPLFFICYDSTALSATPTGLSDSFLKALSKFDRAICVVCEQGNIPLPTFSPSQPDLVAAVVAWIRRSILENRHPI